MLERSRQIQVGLAFGFQFYSSMEIVYEVLGLYLFLVLQVGNNAKGPFPGLHSGRLTSFL